MKKEMNNKGFSLVELIIVIAIMAVLMGVLAPQYLKYVKKSKVSTDITNAEQIATAVNAEIADGASTNIKITSGTATAGSATTLLVEDGDRKVYLPASKVKNTYTWKITYDTTNGVTKIELGGDEAGLKQIWPNASDYETANSN